MDKGVSEIHALTPGVLRDPGAAFEERRSVCGPELLMVESVGEQGEVSAMPLSHLILSQAICHPFHYQCNLGAGGFSGQGMPMDFVVVVPNAHTWCRIDDPHRLRFLAIPMSVARRFLDRSGDDPLDFGPLHIRQNRDPFIAHTLEALWQELALGDQNASLFLETATAAVLARLELLSTLPSERQEKVGGLAAWQSDRVLDYMREHLAEPISLTELAGLVDLSPWHFCRAFRQRHQLPPHRCLT
jgi:AraC family transcriptional regulator